MRRIVVRYKTRPERSEDNERLIAEVFRELAALTPDDVRYLVLKLDDDSFIHFATVEADAGFSSLTALDAFRRFQAEVRERCAEPPRATNATVVGAYRIFE
jgi:hypothetical protein